MISFELVCDYKLNKTQLTARTVVWVVSSATMDLREIVRVPDNCMTKASVYALELLNRDRRSGETCSKEI